MTLSRRRFLRISAAALALSPATPGATSTTSTTLARTAPVARWRGRALGAEASITLAGLSDTGARAVFADIGILLEKIERAFSLYRPDSAISRLNRAGRLDAPPRMLVEVLALSEQVHAATRGLFDPTVQPLWQAIAQGGDTAAARALIGWRQVRFDAGQITFDRPGMAITLNGIAQGYATDRVAARLGAHGLADVLVDIGEIAAMGRSAGGRGWQVGIGAAGGGVVKRITLSDRCLATSETSGQGPGAAGHILHPWADRAPRRIASVSAPGAAVADGLSTAACLLPRADVPGALRAFDGARLEYLA